MKRTTLLKTLLLAATVSAGAQVNSITPEGCLERSEKLLSVGNYRAALDQLAALDGVRLTAAQRHDADWLQCRAAYEAGLYKADASYLLLNRFIDKYPTSPHRNEAILLLGNAALKNQELVAIELYKLVDVKLLDEISAADHNFHTAYTLLTEGRFDEAVNRFEALVGDEKTGRAAQVCLGYAAYGKHDYAKALRIFEAADRSFFEDAACLDLYLAQLYYASGDYAKAIERAEAVVNGGSNELKTEALRVAGESYFLRGRASRAIEYLKKYKAEAENPRNSTLYILGVNEYAAADYEGAAESLKPVTAENNAMGQSAYLYLGEAQMKLGEADAALLSFNSALGMDFDEAVQEAAYYNYAVAKFSGANMPFESSVATFEEFLRRYPEGPYTASVQEYLVAGYLRDQNYESALASINRMTLPGDKVLEAKQQILYALGTRALSTGNNAAALDYLKQADALRKYNSQIAWQTKLSLGEAYYKLGDYQAAVKALKAYDDAAPTADINRPLAHYDLGYAYFATKDYEKSAANFEKMVKKPGKLSEDVTTDALNRIADTYFYREQFDKAENYYSRAYEAQPSAGDYPLFQQGVIQGYRRNYNEKIKTLGQLLADFPTSSLVPDAMLEMTEGYLRLGQNDKAIETYRQLVAEHPTTEQGRRGYIQLAMTLLNNKDRAGAIDAYKQVIRQYPTSDEARIAVEEMQRIAAEDGTLAEFSDFLAGVESAPTLDVSENDRLTFQVAEQAYIEKQETARLERYVYEYPQGAYRADAYSMLMEAADNAYDTKLALSYATILVTDYPDKRVAERALKVKAEAEHTLGRGEDALATWSALEERASDAALLNTARVGIMRVARDLGDNARVIGAADALLASSTLGSEARNEAIFSRALALYLNGDIAAAQEGWAQIASQTDDLYGTKSAFYLAESNFEQKKLDEARTQTEALIYSATPHTYWLARAFILLSDIFAAEGKTFEAREYLISLKENYPGTETDIFDMIEERL